MRSRILVVLAAVIVIACEATASPSPWTISAASTPTPGPSTTAAPTASPGPTPVPAPTPTGFTIMDFNIEYGGVTIDFAKIVEAVTTADADVVALEEAEGNTQQLATEAGYPYANTRNQIISKFPIIDPPGADGRYVYIELAPGAVVAVSNVHLPSDPYGPDEILAGKTADEILALETATRMPAIQERLDVLPALVDAGIPTFLTGDFNAPSHLDWTEAAVGTRPQVMFALAWPVSTAIEAAGFLDTYRELHPDPVIDPGLTWWAGRPIVDAYPDPASPQDRIDIVYVAGEATATDVKIVGEKDGPQVDVGVDLWGTDHRAVLTTFTLTPGFAAPYVAVDERLVATGDPVTVRYHGAAETVAITAVGGSTTTVPYASTPVTVVDGTWDSPTAGIPVGDYEILLIGGGDVLSRTPLSIAAPDATVALTLDAASIALGDPITVTWRDAPGSRWDWIGVYARGGDPLVGSYLYYVYTGQTVTGSVVIDENGEGDWPLPAGEYDAHYLLDDGYTSLAVAPFTVTP